MPRALIAGCGYLGRVTADLLAAGGWQVEGWTISPKSAAKVSAAGHAARSVDISNGKDIGAHASQFDAVIQSVSTRGGDADSYRNVYLNGAKNLLEHFPAAQLLFISSTSVYAQKSGDWVTEESETEPKHQTGKILRETEELVLGRGGTVVRLAGLYGPGRSALLRKFLAGEASVDLKNDRFVNQIHRDDAASAIQFLLSRTSTPGQVYNLADNQPTLLSECYRWLAKKLNRPVPATGTSTLRRKRGDSNKRVSNAKLRGLGWAPRYPSFIEGMEQNVLPSVIGGEV